MQHAVLVAIRQPFKQLLHVTLNLRRRESCARIGQPREIVVAELHDHVDRPLAVVVLACCDREVRGHAPLQAPLPRKHDTPQMSPHAEYTRRLRLLPRPPAPLGKARTLGRHNLLQLHDVFVVQNLENLDLPDRRHGELRPQDSSQVRPCRSCHRPPPAPHPQQQQPRQQRTPSFSLSIRTLFRATISPVTLSLALYTCLLRLGGGAALELQQHSACVSAGVAAPVRPLPHLLHLLVDLDVARPSRGVGHVRRLPIPSTTPSAFPLRRR